MSKVAVAGDRTLGQKFATLVDVKSSRIAPLVLVGLLAACAAESSEALTDAPPTLDSARVRATIGLGSQFVDDGAAADGVADSDEIDSVVMIGDSITVGAQPALDEQLKGLDFDDVSIAAQELKRVNQALDDNPSGTDVASFLAGASNVPGDEQLWIVALGTNDISQYNSVDRVVDEMESVVEAVPDDSPLIWINTYFADRPGDTALVNSAIDRVIADRGNAMVGRWDRVAAQDGILRSDGVHPNDEGAEVFAQFVSANVEMFLER